MGEDQINVWLEHLISCPSECFYFFTNPIDKENYCIYLRWRHSDPWTAELVPCNENFEFKYGEDWEILDIKFYTEEEYRKAERDALKIVNKKFFTKLKNGIYTG